MPRLAASVLKPWCFAAALFLAGCAGLSTRAPTLSPSSGVVQVAVYRLSKDRAAVWQEARSAMLAREKTLPGFHSARTFQSLYDATVCADIVIWSSLDAARDGAEKVQEFPESRPVFSAISDVDVFEHVTVLSSAPAVSLQDGTVMQLAVYTADPAKRQDRLTALAALSSMVGFKAAYPLQSLENKAQAVDLIFWSDKSAALAADRRLRDLPEGRRYLATFSSLKHAGFFTPLREDKPKKQRL